MIEARYDVLTNPALDTGLKRLVEAVGLPFKTAYNIGRICDKIDQFTRQSQQEFMALLKEHGLMGENGRPKPDTEVSAEEKKKWADAQKDFGARTFKIDRHKIKVSDIESVGLTGQEILALDAFLDGREDTQEIEKKLAALTQINA